MNKTKPYGILFSMCVDAKSLISRWCGKNRSSGNTGSSKLSFGHKRGLGLKFTQLKKICDLTSISTFPSRRSFEKLDFMYINEGKVNIAELPKWFSHEFEAIWALVYCSRCLLVAAKYWKWSENGVGSQFWDFHIPDIFKTEGIVKMR